MAQLATFVVLMLPLLVRPACGLVKKDALDSELVQLDASLASDFLDPKIESDSNGSINGSYINCGFGIQAAQQYARSSAIPGDWPCKWKTLKTALPMNKKTILCIGDSITFGREVFARDAYPAKLYKMLDNEFNVVNLGASYTLASFGIGHQTLLKRSYANYPQAYVALNYTELDVAAVIVQLGTNDLEVWNSTSFHHDYYTFALGLMTVHPKAAFVFSIPPMREAANVDTDKALAREIKGVQAELQRALDHTHHHHHYHHHHHHHQQSAVVNMQEHFAAYQTEWENKHGQRAASLFQDGLHPTERGYLIYGKAMAGALRGMLGLSPKNLSDEPEEARP